MNRIKKTKIIFKNADIDSNISHIQIEQFLDLTEKEKSSGVVLSQKSGITNKDHFQIDIHKNNIIVYIHNANYSDFIITCAVNIIDNLSEQISIYSKRNMGDHFNIPTELLDNINREYQSFIDQKKNLIDTVKEFNKKILAQIDECKFDSLNEYLSDKYANPVKKIGFSCEICNKYSGHNLKALAAHKRGCLRKNVSI